MDFFAGIWHASFMHIERQTGGAGGLRTTRPTGPTLAVSPQDSVEVSRYSDLRGDDLQGVRIACTIATTIGPATVSKMLPMAYGTVYASEPMLLPLASRSAFNPGVQVWAPASPPSVINGLIPSQ